MSDLFQQQSPLVQIKLGEPTARRHASRRSLSSDLSTLRGRADNTGFLAASLKVLGCEPPVAANTVVESGDYRIYWMGPDEWLIVTPAGRQGELKEKLTRP